MEVLQCGSQRKTKLHCIQSTHLKYYGSKDFLNGKMDKGKYKPKETRLTILITILKVKTKKKKKKIKQVKQKFVSLRKINPN